MKVLVVVDMQKDFVDGALGTPEAQAIVANVAKKVSEYANQEECIVYYTRDTHWNDYLDTPEGKKLPVEHCIYNTDGWQIVPEVYVDSFNTFVGDKYTFGMYSLPDRIERALSDLYGTWEATSIEVCGLCTDICVVSNALLLKAAYPNVPISVDASCCAGVTPAKHDAALEVMRSCQIDVY